MAGSEGAGLKEHWSRMGRGMEQDWSRLGGGLEDWMRIGLRLEAGCRMIGGGQEQHRRKGRGALEEGWGKIGECPAEDLQWFGGVLGD